MVYTLSKYIKEIFHNEIFHFTVLKCTYFSLFAQHCPLLDIILKTFIHRPTFLKIKIQNRFLHRQTISSYNFCTFIQRCIAKWNPLWFYICFLSLFLFHIYSPNADASLNVLFMKKILLLASDVFLNVDFIGPKLYHASKIRDAFAPRSCSGCWTYVVCTSVATVRDIS